jgi:PBP1b-binding outer membrane lipoprotein LpoB
MKKLLALVLGIMMLSGCGMMQSYNQQLDNNQRTFERAQAVLDAQNAVRVAQLRVQSAQQEAQVNIAIARGKAEAQRIQTESLRPLFVQQELVDAIAAGKVNTLVLPATSVLPLSLTKKIPEEEDR